MNDPGAGPESTAEDLRREILESSEDEALEYLLTGWFYQTMEAIRASRIKNGLTQEAVAAKLGTKQSVVARLENAHRGSFSLERFLEYASACGVAPLDLDLRPVEGLRRFVLAYPNAPRTSAHYERWLETDGHARHAPWSSVPPESDVDRAGTAFEAIGAKALGPDFGCWVTEGMGAAATEMTAAVASAAAGLAVWTNAGLPHLETLGRDLPSLGFFAQGLMTQAIAPLQGHAVARLLSDHASQAIRAGMLGVTSDLPVDEPTLATQWVPAAPPSGAARPQQKAAA